jgi:hypothetical protein
MAAFRAALKIYHGEKSMTCCELIYPWAKVNAGEGFEQELRKEVCPGHVLYRTKIKAIARRTDNDDVLFMLVEKVSYAQVHLTWTGKREKDRRWPHAELFGTWDEWLRRMAEDNGALGKA